MSGIFSTQKDLTAWINSGDVEKVEWLNIMIEKLWPFIGSYVRTLLTGKVQKLIRDTNAILSDFTFTNVNLGKKPPRIVGVKALKDDVTDKDELVVEVQVIYDGDLDLDISLLHVPAGIKDIKVKALLRVEMKPLIDTKPLIGALSFTLLKEPVLKFDLTGLANVLDAPGISDVVRDAIDDVIGLLLVLPQKQIVKLSPTVDISLLRFPVPEGVARIHVIDAQKLSDEDSFFFGGESDPFVIVTVAYREMFKTKTIKDNDNPVWNETFDATVLDKYRGKIQFQVFDDDGKIVNVDYLGKAVAEIRSLYEAGAVDEVVSLRGAKSGKLHLRLEWFDLTNDPKDLEEAKTKDSNCAVLAIYIDQVTYSNEKENKPTEPRVKIEITDMDPLKTEVAHDVNRPTWEENFEVFLKKPDETTVVFKIDDEDSEKTFGEYTFSVKDLLSATDMVIEKQFPLEKSAQSATLHARLTLRAMKAKPKSSTTSAVNKVIVTPSRSKESQTSNTKTEKKNSCVLS